MRTSTPADVHSFVQQLADQPAGVNAVNPFDLTLASNAVRRENLERYLLQLLDRGASTLLVGEAPGYRGMRITGVPFTNVRILQRGIPELGMLGLDRGYKIPDDAPAVAAEPTATVMWQTLATLHIVPALWSAFPIHPHRSGVALSNRTPTATEAASWSWSWQALAELLPITSIVAVGNVAHASMLRQGIILPKVRHPSHGGSVLFAQGLRDLIQAGTIG